MNTPVHIFTIVKPDGGRRRVAIPGGYCQLRRPTLRPGEREDVGARTWRSDLAYIDHLAGQSGFYQAAGTIT